MAAESITELRTGARSSPCGGYIPNELQPSQSSGLPGSSLGSSKADDCGYTRCAWRYGTTRNVWLVGKWAVKVPAWSEWRLFLLGLLANMQEKVFARTGWAELCPVVWSLPGGWMLVMRRAIPLTREEWDYFNGEKWAKREAMPGHVRARMYGGAATWAERVAYTIPVELKMDSFGWIGEQLVAVDYGN